MQLLLQSFLNNPRPMRLLISVITRADHSTYSSMGEAHCVSLFLKMLENIRVNIALYWQMMTRWCKVLTNSEHINIVLTHVAHNL